jgi:tight adherence protein C
MLSEQALSVRDEIKSRLLRQAGRNETRMLIPLVFLILPVTVLFAIYPSLELLNFGFI